LISDSLLIDETKYFAKLIDLIIELIHLFLNSKEGDYFTKFVY